MALPPGTQRRLTTGAEARAAMDRTFNSAEIKALQKAFNAAIVDMAGEVTEPIVARMMIEGAETLPFAETWRDAWDELVKTDFEAAWLSVGSATADHLRGAIFRAGGTTIESDYLLTDYIVKASGNRITLFTDTQLQAFKATFRDLMLSETRIHPRAMAKHLKMVTGLDGPRADFLTRRRAAFVEAGLKGDKLDARMAKLHERLLKDRRITIARHEAADAWSQASRDMVDGPLKRGEFKRGTIAAGEWFTAIDERVCVYCGPMHGQTKLWNQTWQVPGLGAKARPPAHVRCRCVEIAILISP